MIARSFTEQAIGHPEGDALTEAARAIWRGSRFLRGWNACFGAARTLAGGVQAIRPDIEGSPGQRRPSASMSRCLPQVDHEPAHGTWICGSARSSRVGKSPTQRGADLAIRPPFLRLINSDQ